MTSYFRRQIPLFVAGLGGMTMLAFGFWWGAALYVLAALLRNAENEDT